MLDHWTQPNLPKLSYIPAEIGYNKLKQYYSEARLYTCIAQSYHGSSLKEILQTDRTIEENKQNSFCSQKCAIQIGIELTKIIKQFHELGFLHLDIKPDNVLIGEKDNQQLCLIDYGISEKYTDENDKHRPQENLEHISGNLVFISKNALEFKTQSRRDDLICLLYMLIFFVEG